MNLATHNSCPSLRDSRTDPEESYSTRGLEVKIRFVIKIRRNPANGQILVGRQLGEDPSPGVRNW
jgi:hypothetical protein